MRLDLQVVGPDDAVQLLTHISWVLDRGKGARGVGTYHPRTLRCQRGHPIVEKWSNADVVPDGRVLLAWQGPLIVELDSAGLIDDRPITARRLIQHVAWLDQLDAASVRAQCRCRTETISRERLAAL